ncbi:uncharacterized protein LOC114360198 [Ostrinia furnacalis]|uniref:uncharacterized protein LOC114360198 n=1 Tax=Ostrinia furnacalis TaxID=93504 RepID=UPI00103B36BC|nr:uncharacterized protein LOC114360198 [Ostrinia furnacalis]
MRKICVGIHHVTHIKKSICLINLREKGKARGPARRACLHILLTLPAIQGGGEDRFVRRYLMIHCTASALSRDTSVPVTPCCTPQYFTAYQSVRYSQTALQSSRPA